MPPMPSSADTAPSCIAPPADSDGSSSCSAIGSPARRWYWSAWRSTPALTHGQAVVGEAERAGVGQLGHLGQPLALLAARDRGHEAGGDARLGAGALAQRLEDRRGVDDRVGVGLGDDRAVAAGRRGAGAGLDVLLVLAAGRAQVHVRVDEGGERVQARRRRRPRRRRGARGRAPISAISPPRTSRSAGPGRCPRPGRAGARRGSAGRRPGRRCALWSRCGLMRAAARSSWPLAPAGVAVARSPPPVEQLVQHGHPDDDAGLDLLDDQRLGRVDDLGRQLDAAVDRARGASAAGAGPAGGRRSGTAPRTRAATGTNEPVIRSCCIRRA